MEGLIFGILRYIETAIGGTAYADVQSRSLVTKSCYSIEYSIRVQSPKAVDMRYKITKQLNYHRSLLKLSDDRPLNMLENL